MKVLIVFLFTALHLTAAFSQSPAISGNVKDTRNQAIFAATVTLMKAADSTKIQAMMTNEDGKFQFSQLPYGAYWLSVTAVGQKQYKSITFKIDSLHRTVLMPVIILLPAKNTNLAEVVIQGRRPLIEQEIDKTIVNVGSMISSATSNTLEVLEKTPGITVNSNGEISLNGRAGVSVLIDGRSTYMSAPDLSAYLKSVPGALLDKIELIENPSARYDASGNAIINIRLKKNRTGGFTGSVSSGFSLGRHARNNDAFNLNYNQKKINLFGSIGYNIEKNYSIDNYDRKFYNSDGALTSMVNLVNDQQYRNRGISSNLGIDYTATDNTTYGAQVRWYATKRDGGLDYSSKTYDPDNQLAAMSTGRTDGGDKRKNVGLNFNFLHKFDKKGKELSADVNYLNYQTNGTQSNPEFLYLLPSDVDIYALKADYVHPLKNKVKLETGIKSSRVDNDNISDYYDIKGSALVINNTQSNHFKYNETINSAYVNAQKGWKQIGVQLGLRVENTQADGNQLGNEAVAGSTFKKDYTKFFPSLSISYKLDTLNRNTLTFSITRRINRPNYQQLNPFLFFRDTYSYTTGNPLLDPQYQYRYEIRLQHKQFLRMGLSYNKFSNPIFQTSETRGDIFITQPVNVKGGFMVLLSTGLSVSPAKWWSLNTDVLLSRIGLHGQTISEDLDINENVARINLYNQFSFKKGWSAELGGYYASRDLTGTAVTSGMYRTNAGIQKKIMKGHGSVRLSMDDIFHSWVYHNRSVGIRQASYIQTSQSNTQRVGFAFTYRFGSEIFSRKRKNADNTTDEEKGRL